MIGTETTDRMKQWAGKWWVLWIAFFLYTAGAAFLIQLVILPHLIPQAHLGHGLFVLDSTGFHQAAVKNAAEIANYGWSAWELRPNGYYPAGMASVFYYLWYPEPYALIPLNAALHATAGCLVFFLLGFLIPNPFGAASGAALFVLNPASFEWTAQIHRDGTFILGNLMILAAWMLLLSVNHHRRWQEFIYAPALTLLGSLFIWASRPYWNQIGIASCTAIFFIILVSSVTGWLRNRKIQARQVTILLMGIMLIAMQLPFKGDYGFIATYYEVQKTMTEEEKSGKAEYRESADLQQDSRKREQTGPAESVYIRAVIGGKEIESLRWYNTAFVPDFVERKLYGLWNFRYGTRGSGGKTLIDPDVKLDSAEAFLFYFPRALQIAFLSPFPSHWVGEGSTGANTIGRKVVGAVTLFFYGCLVFFFWGAWENRKRLGFWLVVLYSTFGLLVFTYAYANVGILARMRYGFFMLIVSIGFVSALKVLSRYRSKAVSRS